MVVKMSSPFISLIRKIVLIASLFFFAILVQAGGIGLDRTRAVIEKGKNETSFVIKNTSDWGFLIKSHMETVDQKKASQLMVMPSLAKLLPGQSLRLRVLVPDPTIFAQDRETLFWFVCEAIPAKADIQNSISLNYVNRVKVFYRPNALKGNLLKAIDSIDVKRDGKHVVLSNSSPFVISMGTYWVNDKEVDTSEMIPPFSSITSKVVELPQGPVKFDYAALDELGIYIRRTQPIQLK